MEGKTIRELKGHPPAHIPCWPAVPWKKCPLYAKAGSRVKWYIDFNTNKWKWLFLVRYSYSYGRNEKRYPIVSQGITFSASLTEDLASGSTFGYFLFTLLLRKVWRYLDVEYYDRVTAHNFQANFTFLKWITNHLISPRLFLWENATQGTRQRNKDESFPRTKVCTRKGGCLSTLGTDAWL